MITTMLWKDFLEIMIFDKFANRTAVEYTVYKYMEMSNVMKSRLVYADIFIWTGSKPNAFNLRQAKEKKKMGAM